MKESRSGDRHSHKKPTIHTGISLHNDVLGVNVCVFGSVYLHLIFFSLAYRCYCSELYHLFCSMCVLFSLGRPLGH